MPEDGLAQIGQDAFADHRDEIEARAAGNGHDQRDGEDDPAIAADIVQILRDEAVVDRAAQGGGNGQRGNGRDQQKDDGQRQPDRIGKDERHEPAQGTQAARRGGHFRNDLVGIGFSRNGLVCHGSVVRRFCVALPHWRPHPYRRWSYLRQQPGMGQNCPPAGLAEPVLVL